MAPGQDTRSPAEFDRDAKLSYILTYTVADVTVSLMRAVYYPDHRYEAEAGVKSRIAELIGGNPGLDKVEFRNILLGFLWWDIAQAKATLGVLLLEQCQNRHDHSGPLGVAWKPRCHSKGFEEDP